MVAPPLGNSLAAFRAGAPFAFWASLAVAGLDAVRFGWSQEAEPNLMNKDGLPDIAIGRINAEAAA